MASLITIVSVCVLLLLASMAVEALPETSMEERSLSRGSGRHRRVKDGKGKKSKVSTTEDDDDTEMVTTTKPTTEEFDLASVMGTTTINGYIPPGTPLGLQNSTVTLDTNTTEGWCLLIIQGYRMGMTRVGIHVHRWGGHTCVMTGVITNFVEGQDPKVYPAGTCFYMPPNVPMLASNLGSVDSLLVDAFTIPHGEDYITIIEPGYPGYAGDV